MKKLSEQLEEIIKKSKILKDGDNLSEEKSLGIIDRVVDSEVNSYVNTYLNKVFEKN